MGNELAARHEIIHTCRVAHPLNTTEESVSLQIHVLSENVWLRMNVCRKRTFTFATDEYHIILTDKIKPNIH